MIVNSVRCKKCDSVIVSRFTHDFQRCDCGLIAVDGGNDYQKVVYPPGAKVEDYIDFSYTKYR